MAAGRCKSAATSSGLRPCSLEGQRELGGGGRLALALEAAQHEDGGAVLGEADAGIDRPHEGDEFVVDDLDDLLAGVDGAQHGLADGALA